MTDLDPQAGNPYRATTTDRLAVPRAAAPVAERMADELDPYGSEWEVFARFFVFGERFYGLCDQVPGTLHVLTKFFHVWWFPLYPRESWLLVIDRHGYPSANHVHLRRQPKSIAIAWIRALLWVAATLFACAAAGGLLLVAWEGQDVAAPLAMLAAAVVAFLLLRLTRFVEHAGPTRQKHLLELAGFPPEAGQRILDAIDRGSLGAAGPAPVRCRHCGRELAATTRVCPRCERRVEN